MANADNEHTPGPARGSAGTLDRESRDRSDRGTLKTRPRDDDDPVDPDEYARLLDAYDSSFRNISEGEVVKGTVLNVTDTEVIVELPDAGVTKTLQLRFSEDPEVAAGAGIEVETGADGSLFILFYGAPISDEIFGIGSLVRIRPDGFVEEAMPIVDPFSPADPGSPSHLGVTPGTSSPWLMVVAEDGVHVYLGEGLGASGQ